MRSFFQNKNWTLLLAVVALGALTVLAIGLRDIPFTKAQPIGQEEAQSGESKEVTMGTLDQASLKSQSIFWGVAILLTALVSLLLTPQGRKVLLRLLVRVFATYWLIYFLMSNYGDRLVSLLNFDPAALNISQPAAPPSSAPPPVFVPPQQNSWVSYVVSILFVLFLLFVGWRITVFWRQFKVGDDKRTLNVIANIARSTLKELKDGTDSTDVIMKCYFRMDRAVSERRQLSRAASMTPAEFAVRLERAGLPGDAVQRLTRLFEGVRYGGKHSGPKDVNEAIACLTSILNYCGEPV